MKDIKKKVIFNSSCGDYNLGEVIRIMDSSEFGIVDILSVGEYEIVRFVC